VEIVIQKTEKEIGEKYNTYEDSEIHTKFCSLNLKGKKAV
jgi:hypothetical protein